MSLVLTLGLPPFAVLLISMLRGDQSRLPAAIAMAATLAAAGALLSLAPAVFGDGPVPAVSMPWLPLEGADVGLRLDGLAFMFAVLVLGIGALVILYAGYYLGPEDPRPRFFAQFMLFMTAMLGVVLADNLLLLAVFWELTSLASFLLIGYWRQRADARRGARMSLIVTGGGGLALLAGVILLGEMAGSLKLDVVLASGDAIRAHPWYLPTLVLVLLGAFTKSAQFPFHFWLPPAMAAPTPVSAYLHSATMVKAGVFLLARLYPALAGTDAWFWLVGGTGIVTLVTAAYIAIFQHDLKGLLAYSTISHLGLITLLFGMGRPLAVVAGVFHIINHATFKASLFMAAGVIDHETGTRDIRRLHALARYMPLTAVLAIVAALAMAGVPLLNGFLSKEMFFAEALLLRQGPLVDLVFVLASVVAGAFGVAYSTRFVHDVFFKGGPGEVVDPPHEPPIWMLVPIAVLAVLCLLVGVFPERVIGPLLATAAAATLGSTPPEYTLSLWHGFNVPLLMSTLALLLGVTFYFSLQRMFRLHELVHLPRGGREIYDWLVAGLNRLAGRVTGWSDAVGVQGSLRFLVLVTLLAAGAVAWCGGLAPAGGWPSAGTIRIPVAVLGFLAAAATLGVVAMHRRRFIAVVMIGSVGLLVSLSFAALSAPDLALTQLLVEMVSVILLLLALHYLPPESARLAAPPTRLLAQGALAIGAGVGIGALAWAVLSRDADPISVWHLAQSLPAAAGTNVVNVIIVDFRGFDTLGEITVLAIASLLVADLLRDFQPRAPQMRRATSDRHSFMLDSAALLLMPLTVTVAGYMFLRGHNLPGGGFIGGLILATGLLLPYLAQGTAWVEERSRVDYQKPVAAGLLIAGLTGLGSFALGHPFLTSTYLAPELPVLGKMPLASAMFFDLGVFLTVAGAALLALTRLGRVRLPVELR